MSAAPLLPTFPVRATTHRLHAGAREGAGLDLKTDDQADRGADAFRLWLAVRDRRPRPIRYPAESRRIMVGVDFSWASDLAVNLVAGIAATTETLVDLVHVFDGFDEAFVRGNPAILDRVDAVLAGVGRELRMRTLATSAQGVRCVSTSLVGAPGVELTRHARETGADLLVLGLGLESRGPLGRAWSADAAAQALRTGCWIERHPVTPGFYAGPLR
jgi:nucleotide-binding universal stress UspA family protein